MKNSKGITLIALVITIIVMLILVTVTITMAVNGGLFNYAQRAGARTNEETDKEQLLASGKVNIDNVWYDSMDDYMAGEKAIESMLTYSSSTASLFTNGVLNENTKVVNNGKTAIIPKGFKIATEEINGVETELSSIDAGLVIEDKDGNQFVWIPVPEGTFVRTVFYYNQTMEEIAEITNETTRAQYYDAFKSMMPSSPLSSFNTYQELIAADETDDINSWADIIYAAKPSTMNNSTEDATTDPTGKYNEMTASVEKYGGFYIGRYETGTTTDELGVTTIVVKKNIAPYSSVTWGTNMTTIGNTGAVYLSQNMYTGKAGYDVTSTLCYGVQWDSAMKFIKDTCDVTKGNYTGTIVNTGSNDTYKAKNIYDLAGNVWEWTMEVQSSSSRIIRGGRFGTSSSGSAISRDNRNPSSSSGDIGFRVTLYL